jgi:SAM-dependent methyltransferase
MGLSLIDFDLWANTYERSAYISELISHNRIVKLAMPYLDKASPVLDAGCGTGLVGSVLMENGFIVDGIDFSKEMLKKAQLKRYRNLACLDLKDEYHVKLGLKKYLPYTSVISAGVYGDHLDAGYIKHLFSLIGDSGTLAITGKAVKLDGKIDEIFKEGGFEIKKKAVEVAYFLGGEDVPIEYLYAVAVR